MANIVIGILLGYLVFKFAESIINKYNSVDCDYEVKAIKVVKKKP